jgi:hypothetical protein
VGTFVIARREWWAAQEPADDTPESITAAVRRLAALYPRPFRDANGLSVTFATLDANQKPVGTPRPIDLGPIFGWATPAAAPVAGGV